MTEDTASVYIENYDNSSRSPSYLEHTVAAIKPLIAWRLRPELLQEAYQVPFAPYLFPELRNPLLEAAQGLLRSMQLQRRAKPLYFVGREDFYEKTRKQLNLLIEQGGLVSERHEHFYVCEFFQRGSCYTGLLTDVPFAEVQRGLIRPHEVTLAEKVKTYVRWFSALGIFPGPVSLVYQGNRKITELLEQEKKREADIDCQLSAERKYRFWRVRDEENFFSAFSMIDHAYIARGHHRLAAWEQFLERCQESQQDPWLESRAFFPAIWFPHEELKIFPVNRVLNSSCGMSARSVLTALGDYFSVNKTDCPRPPMRGTFSVYAGGSWYELYLQGEEMLPDDPVQASATSLLKRLVFQRALNIAQPEENSDIEYVDGVCEAAELERIVDSGQGVCAFCLFPPSWEEVITFADEGRLLLSCSTAIEPSLEVDGGMFICFEQGRNDERESL